MKNTIDKMQRSHTNDIEVETALYSTGNEEPAYCPV